jgi:hypothetical protein
MKINYLLESVDLKAAIEMWMDSQGMPVTDGDEYSVNPDGTVTIVVSKTVAPVVIPLPVIPIPPIVVPPPVIISPAPPLVPTAPTDSDRVRCDKFTAEFTFPAECAYHHGGSRIPEDVISEDVPGDNGGLTKWGIDQYSHSGVDIKNLTMQNALDIYYGEWCNQKCNLLPTPIAECVHDTFESGGHPVQWLQQTLGIIVDGELGPITAAAANAADPKATATAFLLLRDEYFIHLADNVAHDAQFKTGWLNRNINLRKYLGLV